MTNIDHIREELKNFDKNSNNKEGILFLESALDGLSCILEDADNEKDKNVAKNLICKYRKVVTESGKRVLSMGTSSFEELSLLVEQMKLFEKNGLDAEQDFKDIYAKLQVAYFEVGLMAVNGRRLDDDLKTEIYKGITKNAD